MAAIHKGNYTQKGVTHRGSYTLGGDTPGGGGYTRAGVTHGREITGESYPGGVTH